MTGDGRSQLWAASPGGQVGPWPVTLSGKNGVRVVFFFLHVTSWLLAGTLTAKPEHFLVYKLLFSHCEY